MAKSRLAASRNQNKSIIQPKLDDNVTTLDLTFQLLPRGMVYSSKYNLLNWCYEQCDPQNQLAKPSRIIRMKKLKAWVDLEKKNQTSQAYINRNLQTLKRYITFCDVKNLDPFCQAGYLAYAGNAGHLRHLVKAAIEPKTYQFQYENGEVCGLGEPAAYDTKMHLDKVLSLLDFDVSDWQATIKPFSRQINESTTPYTSSEWYALVKKTQFFFFSIANQLIDFKEKNPALPMPSTMGNIVVDRINNCDITITVGGGNLQNGASTPFNQCMAAAYTLFAYYTAFNDTAIKDVRHPIKVITSKTEGRTSKIAQVRAYKGRSAKDVQALFSTSEEHLHEEANDDTAGFIIADINKRDKVGYANGIKFLETLRLLSKAYSDDPFDTLIYFLDKNGEKAKVKISDALRKLSQHLNLLSERRGVLTEHLVKTYIDIVENNKMTIFKWIYEDDGSKIMNKQIVDLGQTTSTKRTIPIAYAALSCMTDSPLRNALLPLDYSKKDDNGEITVTFKYLNGTESKFNVAAKYRSFLELVERYAAAKNPLPSGRGSRSSTRPAFLLPLGKASETYQWREGETPITADMLSICGIGYGDYFLNINSRRIRVTHSDLEYTPEDNGRAVQTVLQNTAATADKRYRNGHPTSNNKQISQGMLTLTHIANGKTRKEAVEQVKQELKIPVLEYETWKLRNQPTNPNGIVCDGEIDLATEKNWHHAARKFAEDKGIITKGQNITCYQYDLCVFCKSAKLVDDPYAIYKLLSFLDALGESIDQYPERASIIQLKIERFQAHLDDLSLETLEQAEKLLEENGRYPLFDSLSSVTQYL